MVNVLFTIAWGAVAFAVVRALVLLWLRDARTAGLTALAVAGAFAVGAWSPFVLRGGAAAPPRAVAQAPAAPGGASGCRVGAAPAAATAHGHIDVAVAGDTTKPVVDGVEVPADQPVRLTGWVALPDNAPARAACVVVDGAVADANAAYGGERPDVAAALRAPSAQNTGFSATVVFTRGTHRLAVAGLDGAGAAVAAPNPVTVQAR